MKIFIDTANIAEIREVHAWGILAGVTTNPSLIAKEGRDFVATIHEICEIVQGPVSAEVVAQDAAGMIKEGRLLAKVHKHVVVKVPLIAAGLAACKTLSSEGIPVNVTLCFQPAQALYAALAGATYISPFVGRLDDVSTDGSELIRQIVEIYAQNPDIHTQVLAASIRHPLHFIDAARAGAHVATTPYKVLKQMLSHPLTDKGNELFLKDWSTVPNNDIAGQVEAFLASRR
jgi:transaldolase